MRQRCLALAALCATVANALPPAIFNRDLITGGIQMRQDGGDDSSDEIADLSSLTKISSIGDSFASGIGAGTRVDWSCSRYDHSYPYIVSNDERLGDNANRKFQFLACSGVTSGEVLSKQVPSLDSGLDALLISAGGNDVGLSSILNDCVFGWWPQNAATCEKTLKATEDKINNELPGNIDKLLEAAKGKLTANSGRIYYTGYAKFFNPDDRQCNDVTWAVWKNARDEFKQKLDSARRKRLNDLVDATNAKLKEAIAKAGSQVVFVDYDEVFTGWGGRYCEAGVTEPDTNRAMLLFFERGTSNRALPFKMMRRADPSSDPDDVVPDDTFEGEVAEWIEQTLKDHPDWEADLQDGAFEELNTGSAPADASAPKSFAKLVAGSPQLGNSTVKPNVNLASLGGISWWLPDTMKRVFHPQPAGHAIIANMIVWHMFSEAHKLAGYTPNEAVNQNLDACHLDTTNPSSDPKCSPNSATYVPAEMHDLSGTQYDPNSLITVLRESMCSAGCQWPPHITLGMMQRYNENGGCEIAVALPNDVEAYAYRATDPNGDQSQQCWDSFANVTDKCLKGGPNTGWVNGPNDSQFYQSGFRPINDPGAKHPKFEGNYWKMIDESPPDPDTSGWQCKDHCPSAPTNFVKKWCVDNCKCTLSMTGTPPTEALSCPL